MVKIPASQSADSGSTPMYFFFHFFANITGQVPVDFTGLNSVKSEGKITEKL